MRVWLVIWLLVFFGISQPVLSADSLVIKGNKILYQDREVSLQGVAIGDPVIARTDRPLSDYALISEDWNANVVRISIHPGTWRDYGRKKSIEILRDNVTAALHANMFVIIVWQAIGIPDDYVQKAPDATTDDLYDTSFELAKDFWRQVAQEFGNDGRIMFEIWNEPVWPEIHDGTHLSAHWDDLKHYWLTLIGLIRYHSSNVVIVSSNGWGYNLSDIRKDPISDNQVAYAWHIYAGTDKNDPALWEKSLDGLYYSKPVIVSEWGFDPIEGKKTSGTAESFGYLFADRFLMEKGLHHTAWCWHPVWTPPMLEKDWSTLTAFGAFVKEVLWRVPSSELVRPVLQSGDDRTE